MSKFPQVLLNVKLARKVDVTRDVEVQAAVAAVETRLAGAGRVVLRPSGTEPVIRVMVEGRDEAETRSCAEEIVAAVEAAGRRS